MRSSLVMKEAYCQVRRVGVNSCCRTRARITAMKTLFKRLLGLGALAAMGYAVWRAYERRKVDTGVNWDAQPFPYPPQPHTEAPSETAPAPQLRQRDAGRDDGGAWIEPNDGACPTSHPVKAKLTSGIFHVPGGANYDAHPARPLLRHSRGRGDRRPAPRQALARAVELVELDRLGADDARLSRAAGRRPRPGPRWRSRAPSAPRLPSARCRGRAP